MQDKINYNIQDFYIELFQHLKKVLTNYAIIITKNLTIFIDNRPGYCDRGRYKVLCESNSQPLCSIDYGDAFPRYYFEASCLSMEMIAFIKAKKQNFMRIELYQFDENGNSKLIATLPPLEGT